jgi:hypothetical protein
MWSPGRSALFAVLYMLVFFGLLFVVGSVGYAQSSIGDALTQAAAEVNGYKAPVSAVIGGLVVIGFAIWLGSSLVKR